MTIEAARELIAAHTLSDTDMIALAVELSALPTQRRPYGPRKMRPIAGSSHDQRTAPGVENPLWEIVRHIPGESYYGAAGRIDPNGHWVGDMDRATMQRAHAAGLDRTALCARYSWAIPTPGDIAWLRDRLDGQAVVEIGAGGGYWAWQLSQAGIDVVAYDPHEPGPDNNFATHRLYHPVRTGDHENAADHPDRALMLCWPSYENSFAKQPLHHYRGDTVIYIGESDGGCCADDRFFRILRRDYDETASCPQHVTYWGIHDGLSIWRRKTEVTSEAETTGED